MGVFHTASNTFFSICTTVASTVATVTEWTSYILHANYVFVTSLYTTICYIMTLIFAVLDSVLQCVFTVLVYLFDFLSEVYACVCALLVLVWRVCVLLFKVVCCILAGVETLILGLWNGGVLTYKTLQQSAMDVVETCESTTDYISMLLQDFFVYICGVLTAVGGFFTWIVRGLWLGIGYVPATLASIPCHISQWFSRVWSQTAETVCLALNNLTLETYIGICVCVMLYALSSRLVTFMHSRGLTIFSLWRQRLRNNRQPRETVQMTFDLGFESDFEDEDDMNMNNSDNGSDDGNSERGEDSDAPSELTLSDDDDDDDLDEENSAGSETDVSLNSQTFTSEDSDQEIDVQLPEGSGLHSRQSRSSTPSRALPKDMNPDDFERELERERDKRKCVVCQDANKSVLILPCKHMCLCVTCANQIVRSRFGERRNCPLCRGRIERVMNVFV